MVFMTMIRVATTDNAKNTYHDRIDDGILNQPIVCEKFYCGQQPGSGSAIALKTPGTIMNTKFTTESEVIQGKSQILFTFS